MKSKKRNQNKRQPVLRSKTKRNTNICAPTKETLRFTCFTKKALIRMINSWNNNNHFNNRISYSNSNSRLSLWGKLDSKMKENCKTEYCWIKQSFAPSDLKNNTFRPKMPSKWKEQPETWLTTIDIENVMKQYENKYPEFVFIGAVPIDFDKKEYNGNCIVNELCNININNLLKQNKTKLGVIFNLDPHNKPGSHWVSSFANFNTGNVSYFDSYGLEPPKEVNVFMKRLKSQCDNLGIKGKIQYNDVRHQYKNSECGVYCINFILQSLKGRSFNSIKNDKLDDETIFKKRKVFFVRND